MKKYAVVFAIALPCLAGAQSSITVFGNIDTAVSHQSMKWQDPVTGRTMRQSRTGLNALGNRSSHIGFRGTEDLGGGYSASFWLESQIASDDGSTAIGNFSRRSTLSLIGPFGELRVGRDYTPTSWNDAVYDPFQTRGTGGSAVSGLSIGATMNNPNYIRASNTIGYFLPPGLGGFYGHVQYGFSERPRSTGLSAPASNAGRYVGGRAGYAGGPLDVALSHGYTNLGDGIAPDRKITTTNLGASYDFGALMLMAELSRVPRDTPMVPGQALRERFDGAVLGLTAPVGAGMVRASISTVRYVEAGAFVQGERPRADKLALGYIHNLSKRTALYATVARVKNRNDPRYTGRLQADLSTGYAPNDLFYGPGQRPGSATGYDLGITHSF